MRKRVVQLLVAAAVVAAATVGAASAAGAFSGPVPMAPSAPAPVVHTDGMSWE